VVGRVAGLREHLRWYDSRPLSGRRILVTRPREQAADLVDQLETLGAEAIEAPMIRIAPPEDPSPLNEATVQPDIFDWIVFTSPNAVDAFMRSLLDRHGDVRALKGPRLCAIGPGTAERLAKHGIKVDLVPAEYRAEGVVAALRDSGPLEGTHVLFPRADIAREIIVEQLRHAGAQVTDVVAYRTVLDEGAREGEPDVYGMLLERRIDVVTFTSPSAVRNFARLFGEEQAADLLQHTTVAAIGHTTAEAVAQLAVVVSIQPEMPTIPAFVQAIAAHFATAGTTAG
jgi:uroporphyrinogen III methyltransferase/synthase